MSCDIELAPELGRVTAVFDGHLSGAEGVATARAFREALQKGPLDVVWDVSGMAGFDGAARSAWAEALWPLRANIRSLKIVGAKGLTRVGATFLALALGRPHEFVDSAGESASAPTRQG